MRKPSLPATWKAVGPNPPPISPCASIVDYIKFPYKGTMRSYDGSLFDVQWVLQPDESADTLQMVHPFVSGRNDPSMPFDVGDIGEIPSKYPFRDGGLIPSRVCNKCFQGIPYWWENGWPVGTPPLIIDADGFAQGCGPAYGAAYDYGYDLGYDSW